MITTLSTLDGLFKECIQIVEQFTPILQNKPKEYAQVENLVKSAIVRAHLTGKPASLTLGLQHFLDTLIKSNHLAEKTVHICGEIDQIALSLIKGDMSLASANLQLSGLKSCLQDTCYQTFLITREISFAKKLIRRQLRS